MTNKAKVNHVEIPILDLEEAKSFYDTVFHWDMDITSMPDYGLVDDGTWVSLGFFLVKAIPPHGVNVVIEAEDIEAVLRIIEENGGSIVRGKYQIAPDIGYAADFLDVFGNQLSLFSRQ